MTYKINTTWKILSLKFTARLVCIPPCFQREVKTIESETDKIWPFKQIKTKIGN